MNSSTNTKSALELAKDCLHNKKQSPDYEQAVFWLASISTESKEANSILNELQSEGKGIECAFPNLIDPELFEAPLINREKVAQKHFPPDLSRCLNCGQTGHLVQKKNKKAWICDLNNGGCGAIQKIIINEDGLDAGLAIQPYSLEKGGHSFLGSQVNTLKYDSSLSVDAASTIIEEICKRIKECALIEQLVPENILDKLVIIPAPFSKKRKIQPVYKIAQTLANHRFTYSEPLIKHTQTESKTRISGTEFARGEIICRSNFSAESVLLIDDTYGEGATVRACIQALNERGVHHIYLLTLCKNTYGGIKE